MVFCLDCGDFPRIIVIDLFFKFLFTSIKKNRSGRSFPYELDKACHWFHSIIVFEVRLEKNVRCIEDGKYSKENTFVLQKKCASY